MNRNFIIGIILSVGVLALTLTLLVSHQPRTPLRTSALATPSGRDVSEPAPASSADSPPAIRPTSVTPEPAPFTNLMMRLMSYSKTNEPPRLSVAQAEAFAEQNHRCAEALLAAYQAANDKSFLREAMEKFPRDPRVALAAALLNGPYASDADAAQAKRAWLDVFKQAAPDNALADYLSAREHFKAGEADVAVQETLAAAGKPMRDYALDWIQNTEEAYRSAGYPDAEAKALASMTLLMPHLAQLRDVGKNLVETARTYRDGGDETSAQMLLQTAANIGSRLDGPGTLTLLQSLVGVAIQRNVLSGLDPMAAFGDSGQTVQTQLDRLAQRREAIRSTAQQFDRVLPTMSERDAATYFDRLKLFGDEAALRWALNKQTGL